VNLEGYTPVLVTTNGTRALEAAALRAGRVLLASFLNVSVVAEYLRRLQPAAITFVPAGDFVTGEEHLEDELCALAIQALIAGEPEKLDALLVRARKDPRVLARAGEAPEIAADVEVCLTCDQYSVVGEFFSTAPGQGWIRRCA
jgi:phosphosulfolactate phosphohydrolase-like enzyme